MNKLIKYSLFGFAFVIIGLLAGFKIKDRVPGSTMASIDTGLKKLEQTFLFIENNYVEEPDHDKLVDDAIRGLLEGLDPHSFYIPASEMKQMQEQLDGSFDGIGIQFDVVDDTIYVETPISGGPSEKLGIMAGDRIIRVDGETVAGTGITNTEVMSKLKGVKGSVVKVSILRRGYNELLDFDIVRDRIPLNSVDYSYMIREKTGYIRVTRFAETTFSEFKTELEKLRADGLENLILDLRGNPGGYMTMAYKMADEFLSSGKLIVTTDGRIRQSQQEYRSNSSVGLFENGPLVILLDYGSASASEIVSGAVQDHDRGLIIGVRSFGKGLVQIQEEFEDGSAIRIVISKYYTPSGRCIQKPYDKSTEDYEHDIADRFESGEIFDESKMQFPDSLKYKTMAGRTVYGGGGIYPDVFVADDTTGNSKYFTDLRIKDMFRQFSFFYVDNQDRLEKKYDSPAKFTANFSVTPELVKAFAAFADTKGVKFVEEDYLRSKNYIDNRIKAYIGRRLYNDPAFFPVLHETDNVIQKAIELMPVAETLEKTGKLVVNK
ncbi:MAG: S41 family peptidase [Bacteroidia bacterium]|nr:S41 family peptidase [Bacteroidia bacterium]